MHNPELVILDEPFTGFDPINTEIVKQKILNLNKAGTSFILSTHRMESVEELCDHIALINKSNVIINGEINEIREKFKKNIFEIKYSGLLDNSVLEKENVKIISNEENDLNGNSKLILKLDRNVSISQVVKNLLSRIEILSLNEIIPSLHEIFISLVNEDTNE